MHGFSSEDKMLIKNLV